MLRQFIVLVAIVGSSELAHAEGAEESPRVRLMYRAPTDCPDGAALRDRVAARLGYDPFDDDASTGLRVDIARARGGFAARLRVDGARGTRLLGPLASCADLVNTTAVTVSILLDPLHEPAAPPVETPPATAAPPPPVVPSVVAPTVVAPTVVPAEEPPSPSGPALVLRLEADVGAAVGSAPAPSLAADVAAGLGIGDAFRIALGARLRHTLVAVDEGVRVATYAGVVAGCLQVSFVLGCLDVELGAHVAEASSVLASRQALHVSSGVRIGVEVVIAPGIALRALLGAWIPWFQLRLIRDDRPLWEAPPITGGLTVGIGLAP